MRPANPLEYAASLGLGKERMRVSAKKRKCVAAREPVPKQLESQRRLVAARLAKHGHHFAERMHGARPRRGHGIGHYRADRRVKALLVRPAVHHEAGERLLGLE